MRTTGSVGEVLGAFLKLVAVALAGFVLLAAWRASALLVVLWCVAASTAAAFLGMG